MRVISLLGITAAAMLAALALAGSSTDAAIVPSSSSQPVASEPLSSELAVASDEYTEFKQYSKLFTLEPHFAAFQPEGTRLQYDRDEKGRVRVIKAINSKNEVVSEMLVMHKLESDQIDSVFIEDYSQAGGIMSDSAVITFGYDKKTNMVLNYDAVTPRGPVWTDFDYTGRPLKGSSGEPITERTRYVYFKDSLRAKTLPLRIQPWDGKEIQLMPTSDAAGV